MAAPPPTRAPARTPTRTRRRTGSRSRSSPAAAGLRLLRTAFAAALFVALVLAAPAPAAGAGIDAAPSTHAEPAVQAVQTARKTAHPGPGRRRWRPPLPAPMRIVRGFDPPAVPWGPGHRGVDIAARAGETVRAAGDGTVSFSGTIDGVGIVAITHGALRTTYLPVSSRVRHGARVHAGDPIGVVTTGFRHCRASVCLHWGLLRGDHYLDPMSLLPGGPIRLLPLHPAAHQVAHGREVRSREVRSHE